MICFVRIYRTGFQKYKGINNAMEHIGNEIEKEMESYTM